MTQETANLEYKDQSGALNESFSDVFGYFVDDEDFLMGEDVYTPEKRETLYAACQTQNNLVNQLI